MPKRLALAVLVICSVLDDCSQNSVAVPASESQPGPAITPGGTPSRYTTEREAQAAALQALRGDSQAAFELFLYFTGDRFDRDRANYWLKVAKDNGDYNALYDLGSRLGMSDNPCKVLRGIYYLELAVKASPKGDTQGIHGKQLEIQEARARAGSLPAADCLRADTTLEPLKSPLPY